MGIFSQTTAAHLFPYANTERSRIVRETCTHMLTKLSLSGLSLPACIVFLLSLHLPFLLPLLPSPQHPSPLPPVSPSLCKYYEAFPCVSQDNTQDRYICWIMWGQCALNHLLVSSPKMFLWPIMQIHPRLE